MMNLRDVLASSKHQPQTSPTTSVSESNIVAPNATNAGCIKFDLDIDLEVQSPNSSIWDSLFADLNDPIGTPDFMVCSPRRDYMVSSPRRDYMMSSPKRGGMNPVLGSNYGYVPGGATGSSNNKGKSAVQSPLHKVINSCTSSPRFAHGESLALPAIDALFDEYNRDGCYTTYTALKETGSDDQCLPAGTSFEMPATAASGPEQLPTLLECLSTPNSRFCAPAADTMGAWLQMSGERDLYQMLQQDQQQQVREVEQGLLVPLAIAAKPDVGLVDDSYHHGLLGPMLQLESEQEEDCGLQLVHLLLACAEAVAKDDYLSARRYLHQLRCVVSPLGDSMQRVATCFTDALAARLALSSSSSSSSTSSSAAATSTSMSKQPSFPPPTSDILKVYQILYQACPYIKFAHFTANQAIFEAFESEDRVHVIDLDILQGYQWPAFMQALAARPNGAPFLRITGVGYPVESVRETGRQLADLARSLRVPFEFHLVGEARLEDLRPHMLGRRVGEALAVNSVGRLHRVAPGYIGSLIGMIRDQAPNIVTLVEPEASHNGPHFLGRFLEALHYYSAIFDSLDATFPADSAARARVEQCIFAPEILNIVACEGRERVERHERLERWRRLMEAKGFKGVPLSSHAVTQSNILLGLYLCDGYRLTEDMGCILLGWQDRPIIAASAWRC